MSRSLLRTGCHVPVDSLSLTSGPFLSYLGPVWLGSGSGQLSPYSKSQQVPLFPLGLQGLAPYEPLSCGQSSGLWYLGPDDFCQLPAVLNHSPDEQVPHRVHGEGDSASRALVEGPKA